MARKVLKIFTVSIKFTGTGELGVAGGWCFGLYVCAWGRESAKLTAKANSPHREKKIKWGQSLAVVVGGIREASGEETGGGSGQDDIRNYYLTGASSTSLVTRSENYYHYVYLLYGQRRMKREIHEIPSWFTHSDAGSAKTQIDAINCHQI